MPKKGDIVYILGAGVNQCLHDPSGASPPLARNVFRLALTGRNAPRLETLDSLEPLFAYIREKGGPTREGLSKQDFDFEEPLRWLESDEKSNPSDSRVPQVRSLLGYVLVSTLARYTEHGGGVADATLRELAEIIWRENATVITFNYDTLIEDCLRSTSGMRKWNPSDTSGDSIGSNWLPEDGYGVALDRIEHRGFDGRPSGFRSMPDYPSVEFLKPHGSLNWFRSSSTPVPPPLGPREPGPTSLAPGSLALVDGAWGGPVWPALEGYFLNPQIIAGSDEGKAIERSKPPFDAIWRRVGEVLENCKKVVTIGYSFGDREVAAYVRQHVLAGALEKLTPVDPSRDTARKIQSIFGQPNGHFLDSVYLYV
ncbi:MAG: hypothetical protein WBW47_02715, partial [Thermoplasmata archaeon]